jgi:hypothetical protein
MRGREVLKPTMVYSNFWKGEYLAIAGIDFLSLRTVDSCSSALYLRTGASSLAKEIIDHSLTFSWWIAKMS